MSFVLSEGAVVLPSTKLTILYVCPGAHVATRDALLLLGQPRTKKFRAKGVHLRDTTQHTLACVAQWQGA